MSKITVTTDSNSGITQSLAKEMGVRVVPMPFYIDGELHYEDLDLTQEEFYKMQGEGAEINTSQPLLGMLSDMWEDALRKCDEIIHIPMSSGLSGACGAAEALAQEYDGRVHVVDNQRISVTLKLAIMDALRMIRAGMSAAEVIGVLMRESLEASIYITVDTLKYLKQGGRVTPAAAALGTVLNIKPVLQIQGEKLDAFTMVRGMKAAKKSMLDALEHDLNTRFAGKRVHLGAAYTSSLEEALLWKHEIEERFPDRGEVTMDPLTLSVACHTGPGALGIGCSRVVL